MSTTRPFQIYKSSAGSGKTHQLTLEYLKLALRNKMAFKDILGVTFTNKATSEMKSRIVKVLETLSLGKDHVMKFDLMAALHQHQILKNVRKKFYQAYYISMEDFPLSPLIVFFIR
jgi:ATP-dependent exoDNAse (exonuclease V) beta subunit